MTLRIKGATTIKGLTSVNWSPNLLFAAGEQGVWYDPSDFNTMFQDTAGTTPVTATGQSVARINDKSGNNNHATQSTPANRPTLQIDGNGKYYLSFDGSNDSLVTGNINFSATNKISGFSGVRRSNDSTSILYELSADYNFNSGSFVFVTGANISASNKYSFASRGVLIDLNGTTATTNTGAAPDVAVVTGSGDISGNVNTVSRNGVAGTNSTQNLGTGNYGNYPLYIGSRNQSSLFFTGRIYGLIIRGAASTASQIAMTETYMNSKTAAY